MTMVMRVMELARYQPLLCPTSLAVLVAVLALFGAGAVSAHRLNLITTDIEWRSEGQTIDVSHRLHLEDALSLLSRFDAGDGVLDLEASARLLNYVEQNFSLTTREGLVELEPFGAHIDGDTLFIYQRATLSALPPALEVKHQLMQDLRPQMYNQVNWRVGDQVRSHQGHRNAPVAWLVL